MYKYLIENTDKQLWVQCTLDSWTDIVYSARMFNDQNSAQAWLDAHPEFQKEGNVIVTEHQFGLPSAHQIGDKVKVNFGEGAVMANCRITKVHFTHTKVLYDIDVILQRTVSNDAVSITSTRIYNVESDFVTKAQ